MTSPKTINSAGIMVRIIKEAPPPWPFSHRSHRRRSLIKDDLHGISRWTSSGDTPWPVSVIVPGKVRHSGQVGHRYLAGDGRGDRRRSTGGGREP